MDRTGDNGRSLHGRIRALVFGTAYGDALGATVEKLSAAEIREHYGRVTSLDTDWYRSHQNVEDRKGFIRGHGIVTDDTLMTLSLMTIYGNERRHLDAWDMADGMVRQIAWTPRWVPELQLETMLVQRLFYAEKWIFHRHQLTSCDPRQGGIGNMVNCGAAMYIAPIGAVNAGDPKGAYDEAIAFASGHMESYGLEAAGTLAAAVAAAFVPDTTIATVVAEALAVAKDGTKAAISAIVNAVPGLMGKSHEAVTDEFHRIIGQFSTMGDNLNHTADKAGKATEAYRPSRQLSIEELPLALGFALINNGDFYKSVQDGINSGRDTDSIGVMIGAVLGALHGAAVIDSDIRQKLDKANKIDILKAADSFTAAALSIQTADSARLQRIQKARLSLG